MEIRYLYALNIVFFFLLLNRRKPRFTSPVRLGGGIGGGKKRFFYTIIVLTLLDRTRYENVLSEVITLHTSTHIARETRVFRTNSPRCDAIREDYNRKT